MRARVCVDCSLLYWESMEKQCREFTFEDSAESFRQLAAGHTLTVVGRRAGRG